MYILYGGSFTRAVINEMVMAEGGIDYELRPVDILKDEHRSPEFLAINPAGWVPALITPEGETLYETPAISLYLAERHGLEHLAPRIDEIERGAFLSGLFFLANDLEPAMKRYNYPHRFVFRDTDIAAMKQRALETVLDRLGVIDRRLGDAGPFHLGDRFSLVDLTMSYWTAYLDEPGVLDPLPAVRRCADLVRARPKLRPMFEVIEAEHREYGKLQARDEGVR